MLLRPGVVLTSFLWSVVVWPFGLVPRLEPLYIYFSIAALIGVVTGVVVYGISTFVTGALNLDGTPPPSPPLGRLRVGNGRGKGRMLGLKEEVFEEQEYGIVPKEESFDLAWFNAGLASSGGGGARERRGRDGLRGSVILEEDDSEESGF